MNIKVAAFTVSEKSSNILARLCYLQLRYFFYFILDEAILFELFAERKLYMYLQEHSSQRKSKM